MAKMMDIDKKKALFCVNIITDEMIRCNRLNLKGGPYNGQHAYTIKMSILLF